MIETLNNILYTFPLSPLEIPNPGDPQAPPGFEGFKKIMSWAKYLAYGILIISLIAGGVMMGMGAFRRGDGGEHASRIGLVLLGVIVVSGAFSIVGALV